MSIREVVKKANRFFADGKYREAEALYTEASDVVGPTLFNTNIKICQALQQDPSLLRGAVCNRLDMQLSQTQALLEKYYAEVQRLRFQTKDSQ